MTSKPRRRGPTPQQDAYRRAARKPAPWMLESRMDHTPGHVPEAIPVPRSPKAAPSSGKVVVRKIDLSDTKVEAAREFAEGGAVLLHDFGGTASIPGLRIRLGARSATWLYYRDVLDHGHRVITSKTLGSFPDMTTDDARKAASIIKGRIAGGDKPGSRRAGTRFETAFAEYCDHLQDRADTRDKPATWKKNVRHLGSKYLLPKWGHWTLSDMGENRRAVGKWYNSIARDGQVTSAHHCRRVIRALWNWTTDQGEDLKSDQNPGRAKITLQENWQKPNVKKPTLPLDQFPTWLAGWRKLPPLNRAYHLTGLLIGARPGELSRTIWTDLDTRKRTLVIGNSKSGSNIVIPLSSAIARALRLARQAARADGIQSDLIFPGSLHWGHRDALPARGHALRRTYKTVASTLGIPNETSGRLLGHQPVGVSADYEDPLAVIRGAFIRQLQRTISADILRRLGSDATRERIAPLPPSAREVARATGLEQYKSDKPCPAGHVGLRSVVTNRCCQCVTDKNKRQAPNRKAWRKKERSAHVV